MRSDLKNTNRYNYHLSTLKEGYVTSHEGLRRLEEEGILKEHLTGGHIIESTPENLNFSLPLNLKDKPINLWTEEERIWLNT